MYFSTSTLIPFQRSIISSHFTHPSPNMSHAQTHVLAYPFPSSGHVIPMLDFTKALVSRGVQVTILITPNNKPLIPTNFSPLLQTFLLPAPEDHNPNPNLNLTGLVGFIEAMRHLHFPIILDWARARSSDESNDSIAPSAIISDFFLGWTHLLARDIHVPRLVFSPSGAFVLSIAYSFWRDLSQNFNPQNPNPILSFSNLPNSPVFPTHQIMSQLTETDSKGTEWEFRKENTFLNMDSWGIVFNTYTELEKVYLDNLKKELNNERMWAVGPVLPLSTEFEERGGSSTVSRKDIIEWLDSRADNSVVYVCFGSRTFLTCSQMEVLTRALEVSGVNFVLSVRVPVEGQVVKDHGKVPCGFVDRVRGRGFVIEGWAPQLVILRHRAVGAFLTHCGWNSVLEGLVSGVVMLTWPMGADQFTNAKLLVDELGVAVRAAEGEKVPEAEGLARTIEMALGKKKERVKAEELKNAAIRAIGSGGSSQRELDELVKKLSEVKCDQSTNT